MPTQSTTYNSRVTDESLEKRFRDTFKSQGGEELVDDLYAQGVIVPVVDFTAAATGQQLQQNLQTAWDFTTGSANINASGTSNLISTAGFWRVDLTAATFTTVNVTPTQALLQINDGSTNTAIWGISTVNSSVEGGTTIAEAAFVVFLRSGDTLQSNLGASNLFNIDIWYRQIATVNGDLINPSGFTSS